ncbi:MAG: acyltransferase [Paracoccus sp. (in: a-proteobacteria)]
MNLDLDTDWTLALTQSDTDPNRRHLGCDDFDLAATIGDLAAYERTDHADDNTVWRHPEASAPNVVFEPGSRGNIVLWGGRMPSRQPVVLGGQDHRVIIGACKKFTARIGVKGQGNLFFSGLGTTCNQANVVLQGTGRSILLGRDCMLSFEVVLRAADSHAIIDLETMDVSNPPESILIGAHVWLGEAASVLKGAQIGRGSVIASRALVTGDIPDTALAVGVPARVLRQNISWTRHAQPGAAQLAALSRQLGR